MQRILILATGGTIASDVTERGLVPELTAGKHHRDGDVVQHITEGRSGIGHGVGAVGDDDTVVLLPGRRHLPGDDLPLLPLNVRGAQRQNIPAVTLAAL